MAKLSPSGKLWMGQNTLEIPLELFALNRRRLVERLSNRNLGNSIILLQGGSEIQKYDQDNHHLFQQESNFVWCFGVVEADFFGAIEVETGRSTLFMPRFAPDHAIWEGPIWSNEDFRQKYQVDEVMYVDEMLEFLNGKSPQSLLLLSGTNEMSGSPTFEANFSGIENFNINRTDLYPEIIELRTFKTDYELDVMRYVIGISEDAHKAVMTATTPGSYEYQSEAQFLFYIYNNGGSRHAAYTSICGSGPNSAILHYGHAGSPNDRQIEDGDMCCYDMGAQYFGYAADITCSFPTNGVFTDDQKIIYNGYAADITCSFPTNGVFTDDQKIIYNTVLNANRAAQAACRPGVRLTEVYNAPLKRLADRASASPKSTIWHCVRSCKD
ncbi:Aminopeptidase P, N-terminal domain [Popillia japonica]|uniref:Xaa-Pro dipeptidase n=1 Tax=Popillia japonica TaxID=7064 RepID=A0AAW1KLD4_POPJA